MWDRDGLARDVYTLVEIETDGNTRNLCIEEAGSRRSVKPVPPVAQVRPELSIPEAAIEQPKVKSGQTTTAPDIVMILPQAWTAAAAPLVNHLCNWRGYANPTLITLESIGEDPTDEDIKTAISAVAAQGELRAIMLVGDASSRYAERDILPAHYVEFEECLFDTVFSWDGWYGDLNDDGVPEIPVGRFLARTATDLSVEIEKGIAYDYTPQQPWRRRSLSLVTDAWLGGCDGPWLRSLADEVTALLPEIFEKAVLYATEISGGYAGREAAALAAWNPGVHLVYACGTRSNMISLVQFFDKYYEFSVDQLAQNYCYPIVLGTCCGLGDHVYDPLGYDDDLVTDFQKTPGKGSVAWLAFTENSQQWLDYVIAREFVERIDMDGTKSLGQIWLEVVQDVSDQYPEALPFIQMWSLFGDPTLCMTWTDVPVDVDDEAERSEMSMTPAYPNPFSATCSVSYSTRSAGLVELRIYDVSGRLVRTIVESDVPPGAHAAQWDGCDEQGHRAASGVYFCGLKTPEGSVTRKLVVLR
jgi:hypothetical protein